jgi:dipeptidyl aminopeptidase/acylaminoacyl peptidase
VAEPRVASYGTWKSPITSEFVASGSIRLGQVALQDDGVYWVEMRPAEGGRNVVMWWTPGLGPIDVTAPPFNARTRVHEYGGGAFVVCDGTVVFSEFADQRLYGQAHGDPPRPITPEAELRYADAIYDRHRHRVICVREDHSVVGSAAKNCIVSIDLRARRSPDSLEHMDAGQVLTIGNDFYSSPRLSPDGSQLAWLTWNHPNMPWDGTELWVGHLGTDGLLSDCTRIAGGNEESIFQPEWSPDGVLHFVSDRTGWWNLYRAPREGLTEPVTRLEAEFGRPQWVFAMSTYAFESATHVICTYSQHGTWHLASLDTLSGALEPMKCPYSQVSSICAEPGRVVLVAGSPTEQVCLVQLDLATGRYSVLRRTGKTDIEAKYLSVPQPIEFPTEGGLSAHAFYYAPRNGDYTAPPSEKPPLLVISHGGPTSATSTALSLSIQYWTSRGLAVLDVNYGGSTGYGRAYRQRLDGRWGVVDVDDCVNGARYLVERGDVDGARLAIRGGSAGGYTTLSALTFRDTFSAGASYYGISDLEALTQDTHKFESHYLDRLIGPYPEHQDLYVERSPIHFTDRLSCPMILFQGLDDPVVPPNQAEMIYDAVRAKGLPVAYLPFPGEQHGFRRAENIQRALDAELYFYSRVFGFGSAEPVVPVPIANL